MRYSTRIKPFSYLAENADRLSEVLDENVDPLILTDGGEAKAVLLSVREYERMRETLAFHQIVALAEQDVREGRTVPVDEAFDRVRRNLHEKHG